MKCDKLKAYKGDMTIPVYGTIADAEVYLKKDVNEAIAELKQKLEDVNELIKESKELLKESQKMHQRCADNASKQIRRLKRALWLARAERARSSALSYHLIESHPNKDVAATYKRKANKWEKAKDKCLKKAESYL